MVVEDKTKLRAVDSLSSTAGIELMNRERRCDSIAILLSRGFQYGGAVCILLCGYLILSLSDSSDLAGIFVRYASEIPIGQILAFSFGILGTVFGLLQLWLMRSYTRTVRSDARGEKAVSERGSVNV